MLKKTKPSSCLPARARALRRRPLPPVIAGPPPAPPFATHSDGDQPLDPATGPRRSPRRKASSRLWMSLGWDGRSEVRECDEDAILRRVSLPRRDLRILGPVFSRSASILAREKAIIINLEFIKAIVTAEEVLLLDPLCLDVIPFVEQLKGLFPLKSQLRIGDEHSHEELHLQEISATSAHMTPIVEISNDEQNELPFEFQVLEMALEVVCTYLNTSVTDLDRVTYPMLDELATNVSTNNLEHVRSLKSNVTHLLVRVQKVRDEIEHILADDESLTQLYLTRKQQVNKKFGALASGASRSNVSVTSNLARLGSSNNPRSLSNINDISTDETEDLEMLLEAYFMPLDGTRNKILKVRECINDTEDYIKIQLNNKRNELIQLQLMLNITMLAIGINTWIVGAFAMNIPCPWYDGEGHVNNYFFTCFVVVTSGGSFLLLLCMLGYCKWKKVLG